MGNEKRIGHEDPHIARNKKLNGKQKSIKVTRKKIKRMTTKFEDMKNKLFEQVDNDDGWENEDGTPIDDTTPNGDDNDNGGDDNSPITNWKSNFCIACVILTRCLNG